MNHPHLPNVAVSIEQVTPLYDLLLVRRLHDQEYTGLIIPPGVQQTKDGRWVKTADTGPRRGEVVAMGRGDVCKKCATPNRSAGRFDMACSGCWDTARLRMAVEIGDVILYPRFEANHIMIGGEQLTFVHEADVMAVLDA